MATMMADIGTADPTTGYRPVTITSGSLAAWITSQWPNQAENFYITWASNTSSSAPYYMSEFTDSTHFYINGYNGPNISGASLIISQIWTEAFAKSFAQNITTPLSFYSTSHSAGNCGSDNGVSINLSKLNNSSLGVALWLFSDTYWVAGNSQTRNFPSECKFIRSMVAIQKGSSRDLSLNDFTFYQGTGGTDTDPESFFTNDSVYFRWPQSGFCGNRYSTYIAVGHLDQDTESGNHQEMWRIKDIQSGGTTIDPNAWEYDILELPFGEGEFAPGGDWHDGSDLFTGNDANYIYMTGGLRSRTTSSIAQSLNYNKAGGTFMMRVPKSDIIVNSSTVVPTFANTQVYVGPTMNDWIYVNQFISNPDIGYPNAIVPSKYTTILDLGWFGEIALDFMKKSDGNYILINDPSPLAGTTICYALSSNLCSGWPDRTSAWGAGWYNIITLSSITDEGNTQGAYIPAIHRNQTWTGISTDDVLITFSTNLLTGSQYSDITSYWIYPIRVSGL